MDDKTMKRAEIVTKGQNIEQVETLKNQECNIINYRI